MQHARSLYEVAENAIAQYDLKVINVKLIKNDMNSVFGVKTSNHKKFILRITHPDSTHTLNDLKGELDWLVALARDTDINVPHPLRAKNGKYFVCATEREPDRNQICTIFSWLSGNDLSDDISESSAFSLGELSARLHVHALSYYPDNEPSLLHFNDIFPFTKPLVIFEDQYSSLFTGERRIIYQRSVELARNSVNRLKASKEPMRILHGDLNQWNVLNSKGKLSPIDFEDITMGWPVQDIAITLYYFPKEKYLTLYSAFREGYMRYARWPERFDGEVDSFIAARGVCLANFILSSPNPKWKNKIPQFIEEVEKYLRGVLLKIDI